jgi:amino acid adenylation domain
MNVSFDNITHEIIYNPRVCETFELFLNISEGKNGYDFQWSYNTQLYAEATIEGLMQKYIFLLQQIVNNPEQKIKDLYLEDRQEILNKLEEWNNTYKELPGKTVIDLFEETVRRNPDNIAIQFQNLQLTYLQLNGEANRLAHYLQKQQLQPGNVVGIVLDRGPQIIITLLAILKCGATYVPIDPEFPEERIRFMISDSATAFNIINAKYADKFIPGTQQIIFENIRDEIKTFPPENIPVQVKQKGLAYILYTSGSTGKPKGVMITHRNLLNFITSMKTTFNTNERTKLLSVTTVSFDIVGLEIYLPLISGSTLVLTDEKTAKDGAALANRLEKDKINFIQATPATYKMMVDAGWNKKLPITILSGGEAISKSLAIALESRGSALYNMYGPTETTIWSTMAKISGNDETVSIGRPIQNTQVYILDENKNLLPEGKVGEIYIGGEGVASGYYNRPELTAEKFIDNPFDKTSSSKLYRTGDLGKFLADGNIICLGRTDHQAKIRGYRIELEEIEHHILQLSNVKDVVVHIKQNNTGEQKLAAYIIPLQKSETNEYTKEDIIQFRAILKKALPAYMIPDEWIKLNAFPLTPNKKVDRNALEKLGNMPIPKMAENSNDTAKTTEQLIKKIWEEELSVKDIDEEDDFFELGGHSMIAIKVMSKIKKQIGSELPISTLFEHSTIKSIAEVIDTNKSFDYSKVVIPIKHGKKPPIFLVHAGGLNVMLYKSLSQSLDEDQPLYGLQGLGLDGDVTHLESMESIAKRYLSEVLEHDPKGPYIIMGYSYGGLIAYEMARQLLTLGKEVKVLGILDTNAFTGDKYETQFRIYTVKIIRQFKKFLFFIKQLITSPKDFFKYQWLVFNRKYNKNFKDPEEQQSHDYNKFVLQAYDDAYYKYVLKPSEVEIDLFRVGKRVYFIDDPIYLGWKKYALKGVKVHSVPGDHKTFMLSPNNKVLARTLQNVINSKFILLLNALMFVN